MANASEQRDVVRQLEELGFRLARSQRHLIFKHESGASVCMARTPTDSRGYSNLLSDARRALRERGVNLERGRSER